MKSLWYSGPLLLASLTLASGCNDSSDSANNPADQTTATPAKIETITGAEPATIKANNALHDYLPFDDTSDFANVDKGFIASLDDHIIKNAKGSTAFDLSQYDFIEGDAPDTANPSLWRQSQLNAKHGLFQVTDGLYQIRAFDLANMSFIRGKTGWIIVDPLTANETAAAGLALLREKVEDLPVSAVIFTHSHVDHFGGVKGVLTEEEIASGNVQIVAPEHFFEESVNENLMAGNQMSRRASYMYGNVLDKSPTGTLGSGLGTTTSAGTVSITEPNLTIDHSPQKETVDGIEMVFLHTPGAEAPAELMFYIPSLKALCQAEEINHTLHNLYTLRGAKVRSGLLWSKYIHETIERFGDDVQVSFGSHHWPTWGNEEILTLWTAQRDVYRYIHDQTLRLANHGYNGIEIAEMMQLPDSLQQVWANRGYYGSVSHDVRAQYQLYFGWFDGNPANLHALPPQDSAAKYVEYMGGADNIISKAQKDFDNGEYRWVAMALNHVVFADPDNQQAKNLLANAYTQMGYQAESGPWRNFYLSGAKELRDGVKKVATPDTASPDIINNLSLATLLDYLAVRYNGEKAAELTGTMNLSLTDTGDKVTIYLGNGVLNYTLGKTADDADVSITTTRGTLNQVNLGKTTFSDAIENGDVSIEGDGELLKSFSSSLDSFEFWFNIVTP
ncbi:beta-lactamase domain-containing protein [Alcanivorax nanhaiticus]|uniref:Linear primary-alkylsulfatase n=1 Tax=Alcanivorax nanhaiticus TaxID=1177154 RepID=A0A095SIC5_9GAMM|nr:alkyl sulfatase dimerization domain-containing protein [Alcanivorax nanhaiticus]KGD64337.1 beta-lactamase domain-containing protein [Alcanivorax nanhaiticus]